MMMMMVHFFTQKLTCIFYLDCRTKSEFLDIIFFCWTRFLSGIKSSGPTHLTLLESRHFSAEGFFFYVLRKLHYSLKLAVVGEILSIPSVLAESFSLNKKLIHFTTFWQYKFKNWNLRLV